MTDGAQSQDDVERAAAEWVVRLGGAALEPAERRTFEEWLDAGDDHRAAFERALLAWDELGALREDPGSLRKVVSPGAGDRKPSGKTAIMLALLGAGAAAVASLAGDPWIALTADHRTGPDETRTVRLSDGSAVELDATSAISVEFGADARRVVLLSGAVYVDAAPRETAGNRPFVLEAANGRTIALGTRFAVEDVGDGASVEAIEHDVEVSLDGAAGGPVVLSPGQSVRYGVGGLGSVGKVAPDEAAAWRTGTLVFRNTPLADVVATLNRHHREHILVIGAELSARRVSGVFAKGDLPDAAGVIAQELKARTAAAPGFVTILY